ncbi:hypothetical protein PMIN06_001020 [Paraphaeosphaeria minitans]
MSTCSQLKYPAFWSQSTYWGIPVPSVGETRILCFSAFDRLLLTGTRKYHFGESVVAHVDEKSLRSFALVELIDLFLGSLDTATSQGRTIRASQSCEKLFQNRLQGLGIFTSLLEDLWRIVNAVDSVDQ